MDLPPAEEVAAPRARRRSRPKPCPAGDEQCLQDQEQRHRLWTAKLAQLFYNIDAGFLSKRGLLARAKEEAPEIPASFVRAFYDEQKLTQDLRAPRKRSFFPQAPGQQYHADLIFFKGSRSKRLAAFDLALVAVDAFSKKLSVYPLPDKSAHCVSEAMARVFHDLGGPPTILVTDNGKEFQGGVRALLTKLGVTHIIRLRHPRFIDRAQRTFRAMLYKRIASVNEPNMNLYKQVLKQYNGQVHSSTGHAPDDLASAEGSLNSAAEARRRRETNDLAYAHMRYAAGKLKHLYDRGSRRQRKAAIVALDIETRKEQRLRRRQLVRQKITANETVPLAEIFSAQVAARPRYLCRGDRVRRAIKLGTYFHQSENPHWFEEVVPVKTKYFDDPTKATDGSPLFVLEEERASTTSKAPAELLYIRSDLQRVERTEHNPDSVPAERTNPRWQVYRDQTEKLAEAVLRIIPLSSAGLPKGLLSDAHLYLQEPEEPEKPKEETKEEDEEEPQPDVKEEDSGPESDPKEEETTLDAAQDDAAVEEPEGSKKEVRGRNLDEWLRIFSKLALDGNVDDVEKRGEDEDGKKKTKNLTAKDFALRHGDFFQIKTRAGREFWCLTETGKLYRTQSLVEQLLSYLGVYGKPWRAVLEEPFAFECPPGKKKTLREILAKLYDLSGPSDARKELIEFVTLHRRTLRIQQGLLRPTNAYLAWSTEALAQSIGAYFLLSRGPAQVRRILPNVKKMEIARKLSPPGAAKCLELLQPEAEIPRGEDSAATQWLLTLHSAKFLEAGGLWLLRPVFRAALTQSIAESMMAALWRWKTPASQKRLREIRVYFRRLTRTVELQEVLGRLSHKKGPASDGFLAVLECHSSFRPVDERKETWTLTPDAEAEVTRWKALQAVTIPQAKLIHEVLRRHPLTEQELGPLLLVRLAEATRDPKAKKGAKGPAECLWDPKGRWDPSGDLQLNWKLTQNLTISQHLLLETFAQPVRETSFILPHWDRKGPVKILSALLRLHNNLFQKLPDEKWWAFPALLEHDPSPVLEASGS